MNQRRSTSEKQGRILFIFSKGKLVTLQEEKPLSTPQLKAMVEPDLSGFQSYGSPNDHAKKPIGFFLDRYVC